MKMRRRLSPDVREKIWGSPHTEPWFQNPERREIGEIWFPASDSVPILVKLLFTSDNLSVQVHPGDDYAQKHHGSRGKTEMWHILRAEPDAKIALGVREKLTKKRLREASVSGEIMQLLDWVPARPGDTFFVPAGTIHAIGQGIALCEIQQHSDVTYRLYDYGRDRELHLDHGVEVSHLEPRDGMVKSELAVECDYFCTRRLSVKGNWTSSPNRQSAIYVALSGSGSFAGHPFVAGDVWEVEGGSPPFSISSSNAVFLVTGLPS